MFLFVVLQKLGPTNTLHFVVRDVKKVNDSVQLNISQFRHSCKSY